MLTYTDALDFIYSFANFETRPGWHLKPEHFDLARVEQLMARLGDPHRTFRSVHVAGTKGKGSTAAMIAATLRAAGYRTGLYTSPHLHSYRERIQIDGQLIGEDELIELVDGLRPVITGQAELTTFEVTTALAFWHFARRQVDVAVVEVGLGGRLDATNVITPAVCVITPISFDHRSLLGQTLAAIAGEKAGIIKADVPVVCAPQPIEALATIEAAARERGAPLVVVGRDWRWQSGQASPDGQALEVRGPEGQVYGVWIPLLGEHQLANATVAVAAIEQLGRCGFAIPAEAVAKGLGQVHWPGRLEVLSRQPLLVIDAAHNGESARRLVEALRTHFRYQRLILLFGTLMDKEIDAMLEVLVPAAEAIVVSRPCHPRAADPAVLAERAAARGAEVTMVPEVRAALETGLARVGPEDVVCAAGSVAFVGQVREAWLRRTGQPLPELDPPPEPRL